MTKIFDPRFYLYINWGVAFRFSGFQHGVNMVSDVHDVHAFFGFERLHPWVQVRHPWPGDLYGIKMGNNPIGKAYVCPFFVPMWATFQKKQLQQKRINLSFVPPLVTWVAFRVKTSPNWSDKNNAEQFMRI